MKKIIQSLFFKKITLLRWQLNLFGCICLLAGLIAGSYLTLSKIFPKVLALNDTVKVWTFDAANAGNYSYDSARVAVDDSGAHPTGGQVGANKFANPSFDTDNSSWIVAAAPPPGWIEVPGSATYGTSNFLVMKYEAKCDGNGDGVGDTTYDTGYNTWPDNTAPCTSANGRAVVSSALGYPIANISHDTAKTRCQAVTLNGNAAHLILNSEWMTIARNAEAQAVNWTGGSVGSGYLFAGHNDNVPAKARQASTFDTGNYACAYTDSDPGTEKPSGNCPSNLLSGQVGAVGNQKRVLQLSNGSYIWDLAGNVWEHVQVDAADTKISRAEQPEATTDGVNPITDTSYTWSDFAPGSLSRYLLNNGTEPPLGYDVFRPLNPSFNGNQGVGRIYHWSNSTSTTKDRVFFRGGYWNRTAYAGAFALFLNWISGSTLLHVGFRCASDPVAISQSFSSSSGRAGGGNTVSVGNIADAKLYQSLNLGDTSPYDLSVYVYDLTSGNEGGAVSSSVAQLYYHGSAISATYTNVGGGWWKLSGSLTGAAEAREYGLLIKAGKTVKVDDFTLSKQGEYSVYTTIAYTNNQVNTWDTFCEGTLSGSDCTPDASYSEGAGIKYQICPDDGSTCESSHSWKYWDGSAWQTALNTTTHANTAAQLTQAAMRALPTASQKISLKAIFTFEGSSVPSLHHLSVGLTTDTTPPVTNASEIVMRRFNGGTEVLVNGWTNNSSPYFSWTAGADDAQGAGLKGYCLYLGTDPNGDPATAKGLLGTSPVSTTGTNCQFIVAGTSIDFTNSSYKGSTWLTTSNNSYYLNIKAIDKCGNVYAGSPASFQFRFDNTPPTNVSYISCASGSFSNVADMNFSWPVSGSVASSDSNVGLLGWQYQINSTSGAWLGTTTESTLGVNNYIPTSVSSRTLTEAQDGSSIVSGNNIVYFRTVDAAGNFSSESTIRTCNLSYGGAAPAFAQTDTVTVTPSTSTSNSFALSWPAATPASGRSVSHYYYMINTPPPSTLATLQGNPATYIDNGASTTVEAAALPNVNKGTNTVYVVAIDDADTPNYSPSNYITGTFTLNSTDPDNVGSLVASDSSIKSQSQWNVTLTWTAPAYQGAGNLSYLIYRSTDGVNFAQVGSTSGLSYVDNTPASRLYYYKVYTKDGANAVSSGSNAVSITPTGKWTTAPSLESGPTVSGITTKRATITWSTSRTADSKVQYGTSSGSYGEVEPSNSSQVTSHSIQLTGLNPGTTYYYRAKWTDEDGNTGTSEEKSFTTASAPTVKDVSAKNIGLYSAIIQYTVKDAAKVKIYYGSTTSFGGVKEVSTSTSETTYTTELTGLLDGTKYYYKINTLDSENDEYEGTILDFTTLPKPKISNVRIQQVKGTAQTTILVSWATNTEVSSIVTYYPQNDPSAARDEVNIALVKGEHQMIVRGLLPQTDYILIVKGRDKIGNEAVSDSQRFTTATDTRPPQITDLRVEGAAIPPTATTAQESTAQLIVSWNTDEPATSQVEFGEGTGTTYSSKTQEDSNLTYNHVAVISNLTPSKVYHLRAISRDKAGNDGRSIDTVTITPKVTENALNLVITNLQEVFGFIGAVRR